MNPAPLKLVPPPIASKDGPPIPSAQGGPADRAQLSSSRARPAAPTQKRIARRRFRVTIAKRVLPVVALALLTTVALWPEISQDKARARLAFGNGVVEPESGQLSRAHYNGVDEHDHPYTITASAAQQVSPERINLQTPIGDITFGNGMWMRSESQDGVYMQQKNQLDLSGNVTLYRDDGITLQTDNATLDVKSGIATSGSMTHVEGPFGSIDAQGFSIIDRGAVVQFIGPGRMVLNGATGK